MAHSRFGAERPIQTISIERSLGGELLASGAERPGRRPGSQAVWSEATNTDNQQRARLARRAACLRSRETLAEARIAGGLERSDRKIRSRQSPRPGKCKVRSESGESAPVPGRYRTEERNRRSASPLHGQCDGRDHGLPRKSRSPARSLPR